MKFSLLSSLIRGKWLIEPLFAIEAHKVIGDLMNGQLVIASEKPMMNLTYKASTGEKEKTSGMVAVIGLKGTLLKDDQDCGPEGMASIGRYLQQADKNTNIDAIVLHIDSPGGTVDGTEALANIVKNIRKPVVSYVDGLMASAALWVGSSADEIWASSDTDEVGSVGVLLSFADVQPMWEARGIKFHKIVSSYSPDKTKLFDDLMAGNYEGYRQEFLDPIAVKFQSAVRANRPAVRDEHLTGKVYLAKDVMGVFVDRIGTIEQAITRALELTNIL